jgi:hypothetical protein
VPQQELPRTVLAALGLPQSMGDPLQRDAIGQRVKSGQARQLTSRQPGVERIQV